MKIKVSNLKSNEVVAIVEHVLKEGKFSDGVVTNAIEKEALKLMLNTYKDCINTMTLEDELNNFLDDLDKNFGGV